MKVKIEFDKMPEDCPAFTEQGCPYGFSVMAYKFGGGGPCKDKEDCLNRVISSIRSDEKYYNQKVRIVEVTDLAGFGFSKESILAELKSSGYSKLGEWIK